MTRAWWLSGIVAAALVAALAFDRSGDDEVSELRPLGHRDNHDDRWEAVRLRAALGIRVALRDFRLEVLDGHPRRKCHRLLAITTDVELVRRRNFVHEL